MGLQYPPPLTCIQGRMGTLIGPRRAFPDSAASPLPGPQPAAPLDGPMVEVLCITCNVGALLKHVEVVSEEARAALVDEVGATVARCRAALVAIHFQECPTPLEVCAPQGCAGSRWPRRCGGMSAVCAHAQPGAYVCHRLCCM